MTNGSLRHGITESSVWTARHDRSVCPWFSGLFVTALAIATVACSNTPPQLTAPSFDMLITNAQIVDGTGGAPRTGLDRDCRRQDRGGRRGERHRGAHHRREGPHRRARLHRPAQPLRHAAHHRRQRPEQDPPGRDDRGDRRIRLGGAAESGVGDGALDRLRRLLRRDRKERHLAQPAVVRRPRHGPRDGDRRRRSQGDRRRDRARCRQMVVDADGPGHLRRLDRPDLSAQRLRDRRRAVAKWRSAAARAARTPRICATTA